MKSNRTDSKIGGRSTRASPEPERIVRIKTFADSRLKDINLFKKIFCLINLILGSFYNVSAAYGEYLYFSRGGEAILPARVEGSRVFVAAPTGEIVFNKADFSAIVPGGTLEAEWHDRLERALKNKKMSTQERFETAWFGVENGFAIEAESLLRAIAADDPQNSPTSRMLATLDKAKRAAAIDPDTAELAAILPGPPVRISKGRFVVLLHQLDTKAAAERVELLDRVFATYYLVLSAWGIDLRAPRSKLVSVAFANRSDYLAFLHDEGDAIATTQGHYHPIRRVSFSYSGQDSDESRRERAAIDRERIEIERLDEAILKLPANGRLRAKIAGESMRTLDRRAAIELRDRLERDLNRQIMLNDLNNRSVDMGNAAHELIHQLVAVSGGLPGRGLTPIWLQEGLAMQFEVVRGGRWAGVGRVHDTRLPVYRSQKPFPRLAPLIADQGFGHGYQSNAYAQAWALVYFLRQKRPREFIAFLDRLRGETEFEGERAASAERYVEAFKAAFGDDLESLEIEWRETIKSLETPLDSHRPDPRHRDKKVP